MGRITGCEIIEKKDSKFLTEITIAMPRSICSFMLSMKQITGFIFAFDGRTSIEPLL